MSHKHVIAKLLLPTLALFCTAAQSTTAADDMQGLSKADASMYAASHFLGFYMVNGRVATDVCKAEGVDLTPYARAFKLKHSAELARAEEVMKASGISAEKMATVAYGKRNELEAQVRQTMLQLAVALRKTTIADGCAYVADNVTDAVSAQSYAELNPDVDAVLMSD